MSLIANKCAFATFTKTYKEYLCTIINTYLPLFCK